MKTRGIEKREKEDKGPDDNNQSRHYKDGYSTMEKKMEPTTKNV